MVGPVCPNLALVGHPCPNPNRTAFLRSFLFSTGNQRQRCGVERAGVFLCAPAAQEGWHPFETQLDLFVHLPPPPPPPPHSHTHALWLCRSLPTFLYVHLSLPSLCLFLSLSYCLLATLCLTRVLLLFSLETHTRIQTRIHTRVRAYTHAIMVNVACE